MAIIHTITRSYKDQSPSTISCIETPSANSENNIDDSIPISVNHQVHWACTVANLKSIVLYADGAVNVFTNDLSTGSPQETIALAAGQAYIWTLVKDGVGKIPFAGNVTTIYVTNATAAAVAFKIRALQAQ